jgi:lipopolysaccharide biosynthesis regulator YciM
VVTNHLTAGILKYFGDSFRLHRATELFERIVEKEPDVASLLAKCYIGMSESSSRMHLTVSDEEIKAVKIIHKAIQENPSSYTILHTQCDLLLSKNHPDWARKVAQQAVNSAPSEFVTWARLTEAYIELGQYDSALLTLNSCPMFTFNERDLHRMPTPARTHLPVKKFIADSNILDEESARDNEVSL